MSIQSNNLAIFKERVRYPIPERELERRWSEARKIMEEKEVDVIICQNNNQWLGGYFRWFTDIPVENAYPFTMLFYPDDEMSVIGHGGSPLPAQPPSWALRGVKNSYAAPYLRSLNYTDNFDAEIALKELQAKNCRRIGLLSPVNIPSTFYNYLQANLPNVEFIDVTNSIDEIKAVKSEDEMVYVRKTMALQDLACSCLPAIIRPGRYEYDIKNDLVHLLESHGSEEQLIMMMSAPIGQRVGNIGMHWQNRQIQKGDNIMIMIEVNGPGGFYGEIGRSWVLGEPNKELVYCWDKALEGQKLLVDMLKPGASSSEIIAKYNDFAKANGFLPDTRLVCHGQGYDLVERPAIRPEEMMTVKEGMNITMHPTLFNDEAYVFCCDNYYITKNGAERMHKTPQTLMILDC